jgi:hypothetical protein
MRPAEPDPYAVLGLRPGTPEAEAKVAYRQQMMLCHPDRHPGLSRSAAQAVAAEARSKQLNAAMDSIRLLQAGGHSQPWQPASRQPTWEPPMSDQEAAKMYRTRQPWKVMSSHNNIRVRLSIMAVLVAFGLGSKLADRQNWARWGDRGGTTRAAPGGR